MKNLAELNRGKDCAANYGGNQKKHGYHDDGPRRLILHNHPFSVFDFNIVKKLVKLAGNVLELRGYKN